MIEVKPHTLSVEITYGGPPAVFVPKAQVRELIRKLKKAVKC